MSPVARCKVEGCQWQQFREEFDDAVKLLQRHEQLRHPEQYGAATNGPAVPEGVHQLATVDWWTQAIDAIASYQPGARFTIYEACSHLGEPPTSNGWQSLARDAHHLGLVRDVGGVNSKRPGTKGSKTTLWERTDMQHRRPA
jgi:hypothetical protein